MPRLGQASADGSIQVNSRFIKPRRALSSNTTAMNLNTNQSDAGEMAAVTDCLTKWYAANDSVRHLWAIQERGSLIAVFITLEPTSDCDDDLPVWFAKGHQWVNELTVLTRCEVQLELLGSSYERPGISAEATIAELSWRDPCI
jgi:hypothetical protein